MPKPSRAVARGQGMWRIETWPVPESLLDEGQRPGDERD